MIRGSMYPLELSQTGQLHDYTYLQVLNHDKRLITEGDVHYNSEDHCCTWLCRSWELEARWV
jgi:hypothetical protein